MILMKDIIDDTDQRIRQVSSLVPLPLSKEDKTLLQDMHTFLVQSQDDELAQKYDLRPAVGIAAIQLGIPKRMCAIRVCDYDEDGNVTSSEDYALVNPKIVSHTTMDSYLSGGEGCLSVNHDVKGFVPRHAKITVEAYDLFQEKVVRIVARGFMAICMQHEFDHFEGILFYDRINKKDPMKPLDNAMIVD